jgi:protein-S-isoprenylcysteine O-methyltransferase Ste14
MNWFPLVALVAFLGVGFGWRSWLHRRRHGASGIVIFRSGHWAQHAREALMLVLFVLIGGQALAGALAPSALDPILLWQPAPPWIWLGAACVLAAILLTVVAQLDMGASWRVGIEPGTPPGLVVGGLFRFTRNPIYLSLLLGLAGLVLLQPTWLSVVALVAAYAGVRKQVAAEEEYLGRAYGEAYTAYAARVGRFLPLLGRLSPPHA